MCAPTSAREGTAVTPASFEYEGLSVGVLAGGEHRRSAAIRSAIHEAFQRGVITADDAPASGTAGSRWSAADPATRN